jgi:hypothetical protein
MMVVVLLGLKKPQPSAAAGAVCSFHPEIPPCLNKSY